jgi:outer membrane protein assembly factor BamB
MKVSLSIKILFVSVFLFQNVLIFANKPNKWRGPSADGIYNEPGLMESWPDNGPEILWVYEEFGEGFSSPVFANGKIYVSGAVDDVGYIFVLNEKGEYLNRYSYGNEFIRSYPGSRSTPTVVENLIYMHTAMGKVVCLEEPTGEIKWSIDLFSDFDGENLRFGMTESLVVEDDRVYVSPGGKKHNLVALNRYNGELIWSSTGMGSLSAYCTPLLFEFNGTKMLATMMGEHIVGLDRESGSVKWSYPYKNQRGIHPNTPIFKNGELYCFSGYGYGGIKLLISPENNSVEKVWWSDSLQSKMGGAVLLENRLYGSGDNTRRWYCVDWFTGQVLYSSDELANGVVIAANDLLYMYTDRGELALVKPHSDRFEIVGQTKVTHGTAQHWAHPVIRNGVLYLRHGKAIVAYKIKQ